MGMMMKRIAIIGAAGYVGMELSRHLQAKNYQIFAIVRENGRFLLRNSGFNLVDPSQLGTIGTVDIVVNLAYPTSGLWYNYSDKNREILNSIKRLMAPHSRLIHVSTQAVFGYGMERAIVVGPVPEVRDYCYIEAKVELENLILRELKNQSVQIVRLGNVWGPGSGWTAQLVSRILFGEPVGIQGVDGFCNVTDVANAASYLSHLIAADNLQGISFFHLAEFSEYRWSIWVKRIEAFLGENALFDSNLPPYPVSLKQEVWNAILPITPAPLYRKFINGRFSASLLKPVLQLLGEKRYARLKKMSPKPLPTGYSLSQADGIFLTILGAGKQFENVLMNDWVPPVGLDESWLRAEQWARSAGYND